MANFGFFLASVALVLGVTSVAADGIDDDIAAYRSFVRPIMDKCMDKLTAEEKLAKNAELTTIGCVLIETEIIDAKGMFDKDKATTLLKSIVKNEELIGEVNGIRDACLEVNKEDVSDGEKGVKERAFLLATCLKEHLSDIKSL